MVLQKISPKRWPNANAFGGQFERYTHKELKQSKRDKTKVTLMFLWEAYKEQYGSDAYEYTQFRVHYRRYKQKLNPSGEKLFVDYSGVTLPIYDQSDGSITTAQVFVAVLGASGYTFVHVTPSQKTKIKPTKLYSRRC